MSDIRNIIGSIFSCIAAVVCVFVCIGCASRGVNVTVSSASGTNLLDVNWDEYKLPIFSIISGPRTTIWINKEYIELAHVRAGGSVTNSTSACGVYSDNSGRNNFIELDFRQAHTNTCIGISK